MTLTPHLPTGIVDKECDLESDWCHSGSRLRPDQEESVHLTEVILTTGDASSEVKFLV